MKALALALLTGCGGFELTAMIGSLPGDPDQLQIDGRSGILTRVYDFASVAEAKLHPPIFTISDGEGPHDLPIPIICDRPNASEGEIRLLLKRFDGVLALTGDSGECSDVDGSESWIVRSDQ